MNNYNYVSCDYIGATGQHTINDYIDYTSNILDNKIIYTSNILKNYTDTNIYLLDNKYNKLIKQETEDNFINTYITNSNIGGEIRFYNNKPTEFDIPNNAVYISASGYLMQYYKRYMSINLIESSGYKNVIHEIMGNKANLNLYAGYITALQAETSAIVAYLLRNRPQNEIGEIIEAPAFNYTSIYSTITSGLNNFSSRLQRTIFNHPIALMLGTPIAVGIFSFAQHAVNIDASHTIATAIINQYNSNLNLTPQEKTDLLIFGSNLYTEKFNDAMDNFSNMCSYNGFINTNNNNEQYIPDLKTTDINSLNIYQNGNNINTIYSPILNFNSPLSNIDNSISIDLTNYTSSNVVKNITLYESPNLLKKFGFNIILSTPIYLNSTVYYKYDIDLRNYTQTKPSVNPLTPYRIFNIRIFLSSVYFQVIINNTYNILNYEIYMSNEINAGTDGGVIGINILANHIGNTPPNPLLTNILPSYFTLIRTIDFNYLSVISTIQNINLNCIIQDILY